MKPNTISLRRRHLMMAGLATPATLFAAQCSAAGNALVAELSASAAGGTGKLVVSGRILGANGKPLAGALVEALHADSNADAGVATDADGRFMFTATAATAPAASSGRPRPIHYRVSHKGHETLVKQLHFARTPGASDDQVAQLQRDDAGVWRGTFGLTLA